MNGTHLTKLLLMGVKKLQNFKVQFTTYLYPIHIANPRRCGIVYTILGTFAGGLTKSNLSYVYTCRTYYVAYPPLRSGHLALYIQYQTCGGYIVMFDM